MFLCFTYMSMDSLSLSPSLSLSLSLTHTHTHTESLTQRERIWLSFLWLFLACSVLSLMLFNQENRFPSFENQNSHFLSHTRSAMEYEALNDCQSISNARPITHIRFIYSFHLRSPQLALWASSLVCLAALLAKWLRHLLESGRSRVWIPLATRFFPGRVIPVT